MSKHCYHLGNLSIIDPILNTDYCGADRPLKDTFNHDLVLAECCECNSQPSLSLVAA